MSQCCARYVIAMGLALVLGGTSASCRKETQVRPKATAAPEETHPTKASEKSVAPESIVARASLAPGHGSRVTGQVTLTQERGRVTIVVDAAGLSPGAHGIHVHSGRECEPPDFESAGDHFNPEGTPHGGPHTLQRHAGDLGNLMADRDGKAHLTISTDLVSLGEDRRSVLGRTVIIHERPDDFHTQPSGDSGARVACGVIVRVKKTS